MQHTKTDSYGQSTYTYDGSGRIIGVSAPGKTTLYTYDASGNRVSMSETYTSDQSSGFTQETGGSEIQYRIKSSQYMYSNANKLLNLVETMEDAASVEVLEKTTKYLYDNNGNQLNQKSSYIRPAISVTESFHMGYYAADSNSELDNNLEITDNVYDGFNRLKKVDNIKKGARAITEFTYDGDDLRVSKTVKSSSNNYQPVVTNYLYDRQHVILETDASDNVKVRYIRGINYIARVDNSNNFSYYLYNGHGDVVQTVAENGTVENQYEYDIFGNPILTIESYSNAIRYAGEFMDESTGLYYLRARYYDSYTGRFISEDSYWGEDINPLSLNLYTYCHNDPINYIDPTGFSDIAVRLSNESQGNKVNFTAGKTTGSSAITITGSSGGSTKFKEGKDYYIGGDGSAYYINDSSNAVRVNNESRGNTVSYSAGSSNGESTIAVTRAGSNSTSTLKEGADYYIGNNGTAYYYSNVRSTNESQGNSISYNAGTIIISNHSTRQQTSLQQNQDFYIGADGKAHSYTGPPSSGPVVVKNTSTISSQGTGNATTTYHDNWEFSLGRVNSKGGGGTSGGYGASRSFDPLTVKGVYAEGEGPGIILAGRRYATNSTLPSDNDLLQVKLVSGEAGIVDIDGDYTYGGFSASAVKINGDLSFSVSDAQVSLYGKFALVEGSFSGKISLGNGHEIKVTVTGDYGGIGGGVEIDLIQGRIKGGGHMGGRSRYRIKLGITIV